MPKTPARHYRELAVWQKAMDLVIEAYRLASQLPRVELYALASQVRRAAVSVPANVAEGNGRHRGEYAHHVSIARGSLLELETLLHLAVRLDYLEDANVRRAWALCDEVSRMLLSLSRALAR